MDVDTSSYRRPEPIPNALDVAGKLGSLQAQAQGIQRQGIGIESDKLKLMNERLGILGKEYTTLLADPDVVNGTPAAIQKVQAVGQRMVNLGAIPAPMFGEFAKSIPTDSKLIPQWLEQQMARVQTISEATNYHLGQNVNADTGAGIQPLLQSNKPGFNTRSNGQLIPAQVPPTAQTIDPAGQQRMQGVVAPQGIPGGPGPAPPAPNYGQTRLPVAPLTPPNVNAGPAPVTNKDQTQLPSGPRGPATGQPVSFETNRLSHVKDYEESSGILQATRPLLKAYKLIDQFNPRTGPTTGTFNDFVATLKSNNIIPTQTKNDPTAIYQEINKYLAQSVAQQGAPSDAKQAQLLAGSPDANKQILPALKKLTYDTIALQRGKAILPYMYNSQDYGTKNYQEEKGKNVNKVIASEKALMIDHMSDADRNKLLREMKAKQNTLEGRNFAATLEAMKRGGFVDVGNQ